MEIVVKDPDGTERSLFRTVTSGGSFGSSSYALEIELGDLSAIDEVRVLWPGGSTDTWRNLPLASVVELSQGQPTFRARGRVVD